jgi:ATP-dependent Clp protease ATP-binding subunit ClpX
VATIDSALELTLPAAILDLGQLLRDPTDSCSPQSVQGGTLVLPERVDASTADVLAKARNYAIARKALGIRRGQDTAVAHLRIRIVSFLSWQCLRMSRNACDVGPLAAAVADRRLTPSEALLRARHEIGAMLTESTLAGTIRDGESHFSRVHLPIRTVQWLSGGSRSQGFLTKDRMPPLPNDADALQKDAATPGPIPSVSELQEKIRAHVAGLDEQVRALSSRLVMHLARASLLRKGLDSGTGNQAVLIVGNSGCGKTFLVETAAKAIGCPFASMAATAMTSEGYVGGKLDDLFKSLMMRTRGDLHAARFGIAFTDEWDKKAIRQGRDITTTTVQQEMLVPMQGAEFQIGGKRAMERPLSFDSRGTFFAFAGAFPGLEVIIRKRKSQSGIGFSASPNAGPPAYVLDAIREYGYIREFVNRLTAVMCLPDPSLVNLEEAASNGILDQFNILVGELGLLLFPHPDATPRIAAYALESKTFYRGVRAVWWSIAETIVASGATGTELIGVADVDAAIAQVSSGVVRNVTTSKGTDGQGVMVKSEDDAFPEDILTGA